MQMVLEALLLRYLGKNLFCVALRKTSAVICIECSSSDSDFASVGPYNSLPVQVELGEYQVQQGVFKNSSIVAPNVLARGAKTTSYRRLKC